MLSFHILLITAFRSTRLTIEPVLSKAFNLHVLGLEILGIKVIVPKSSTIETILNKVCGLKLSGRKLLQ